MLHLLILAAGFILLIFGADKLVDASSSLAKRYNIPNIVIGLTIVAFGTSAPELVVNSLAAYNDSSEMVLGNVIGSNIFNVLAILGVTAIIFPINVKTNTTWIEVPLSFLAALCVLVITQDVFFDGDSENFVHRSEGIILLFFFIIFLVYNLILAKKGDGEELDIKDYSLGKSILFMCYWSCRFGSWGALDCGFCGRFCEAFGCFGAYYCANNCFCRDIFTRAGYFPDCSPKEKCGYGHWQCGRV
jgi:cation:H+ antiporter